MRARTAVIFLPLLAACAASELAPRSPAAEAHPGADPVLLGTPSGAPNVLPIEQVSVRVHRAADGRLTIVEFLTPGLSEAEQSRLRLAFEQGRLLPAGKGADGEQSWTTTLQLSPSR